MKPRRAAVAATVFPLLIGAPAAHAVEDLPYCAINVSTGVTVCAPDEAGLVRALGGGHPFAVTSSVTVARLYDGPNRTGSYTSVLRSGGCDSSPDQEWSVASMPAGWNDRVSSFQGYASCEIKLWEHGWFSGATYGPAGAANSLGYLDNRTSSFAGY